MAALALLGAACSRTTPPAARADRSIAAPLESLLVTGESIYYRGAYDSVRRLWADGLQRARVLHDSVAQARFLTWLGLIAWRQGDYRTARQVGEQALALKLRLHLQRDLFKSYNALGLLAWNEARLRDAIALFDSAAAAARAVGDVKGGAAVSSNLGLVYTDLGDFAAARVRFRAARDGGLRLRDARVEGNALTNLGMLDIRSGDPAAAVPELTDARERYRAIGYATGEQNALGQLGTAYDGLGEPQLALAALDSALMEARAQGLLQDEAGDLEALARLYQEAGDARRALALYAQANVINAALHLDNETGADLRNEAEIHATLGDLDLASRFAQQARTIHHRVEARVDEMADLLLLADASDRADHAADSRSYLAAAHRIAVALQARSARLDVALAEARIADRARDPQRVIRVLTNARADLANGGYDTQQEAAALLCRAYTQLGRLDSAVRAGREAVAAVERVRGNFGPGFLRTSYLANRAAAYADLVIALARRHDLDEAFAVSDAARGRALLETFIPTQDSAREMLLRRIDYLVAERDRRERESAPHPDSAARAGLATFAHLLEDARNEYERLEERQGAEHATADPILGGSGVPVGTIRASLHPGEALLEYLVTDNQTLAFVVTSHDVRLFMSPIPADNLVSRVRLARNFLSDRHDSGVADAVLAALYETLIAPAQRGGALAQIHSLTIIPYGVLTYLPFATLRDANGRYLAETYELTYLPSASSLPVLRARSATPVSVEAHAPVQSFAPDPEALPATRAEAVAVSAAFPAAQSLVGRLATERRLRAALASAAIVHVAGHGVMNAANPLFSRIELARGGGESADDGRLEVHEVLGLHVVSGLVFLSGCETDLGTAWSSAFAAGEDYTTLARAFLYAGARNVVATLWRVDDDGAAAFAQRFYRHLQVMPASQALATAQRDMLAEPRYRMPYYWASYRLSGSGLPGVPALRPIDVSARRTTEVK